MYSLFKGFFDAISEAHSDKVFSDMADVMSSLINTGIELPVKMFDLIFEQILPYARVGAKTIVLCDQARGKIGGRGWWWWKRKRAASKMLCLCSWMCRGVCVCDGVHVLVI